MFSKILLKVDGIFNLTWIKKYAVSNRFTDHIVEKKNGVETIFT